MGSVIGRVPTTRLSPYFLFQTLYGALSYPSYVPCGLATERSPSLYKTPIVGSRRLRVRELQKADLHDPTPYV